ncbi:MAG: hypothetical protein KIH62_000235 [Candidatus Kerfeldbacteria bacterium]|nr:hypothetical protein [Candidatus Kerfeldbacteria bacterium]
MKLYTDIFRQSWTITKRNPVLWVLGVFILFWVNNSVDLEQVFSSVRMFNSSWSPFRPEFWDISRWAALTDRVASQPQFFAPFLLILLALGLFVLLIITAAHVAIINAHARNAVDYSFSAALASTEHHMAPAMFIQCLNKVVMYGCIALACVPFFFPQFGEWKALTATLVLMLTFPLMIIMSIVSKYALIGVVTRAMKTGDALRTGWKMFRANIGVSLEMAIMMVAIFASLNFISIVAALIVLSPIFIGASLIAVTSFFYFPLFAHSMMVLVISFVLTLASGALFSSWHLGNWTMLYQELEKEPLRSKAHRLLHKEKTS